MRIDGGEGMKGFQTICNGQVAQAPGRREARAGMLAAGRRWSVRQGQATGSLEVCCPGKRRDSEDTQEERWHAGSNVLGKLFLQQFIEGVLEKNCICQSQSRSCICQNLQAVR